MADRRVDDISRSVYDQIEDLDRKLRWRFVALAIVLLLLGLAAVRLEADSNHEASLIQRQRYDASLSNCLDSNRRHDATLERLRAFIDQAETLHPHEKARLEASYTSTKALIDALAPRTGSPGDQGVACKVKASSLTH